MNEIDTIFTDDLSYKKVATQSHTSLGPFYVATNAVDRNTTTYMKTLDIGRHSEKKKVWWKVDLGAVYSIYSVNIQFKNYDGYGMLCFLIVF